MVMNLTAGNDALKQHYLKNPIEEVMYTDRPLFGLAPKFTAWGGANNSTRAMPIPIGWANGNAVSGSFSVAQASGARNPSKINSFQLTSVQAFGFAQIDNETMLRSESDIDSFVDLATYEIDGVINSLSNRLHQNMYGDATGKIGQISNSSFSTSVAVLVNPEDAVHFEVGDELVVSGTTTGANRTLGSNSHGLYVIAVDRNAGTFTSGTAAGVACNLNDSADGIPTISQNDYLFHRGDNQNGTSVPAVLSGLEAWFPFTAPGSSDSFFNVNRSQDTVRLAGSRMDGTSYGIEEALVRGTNTVAKQGGKVTEFLINFKKFSDLVNAIGSKREYVEVGPEDADVGYEAVKIIGARGSVNVIPDQACPSNRAYGVNMGKLKLCSVGEPVRLTNTDGLQMLRLSSSDAVEVRYASYSQLGCWSPRDAVTIQLAI